MRFFGYSNSSSILSKVFLVRIPQNTRIVRVGIIRVGSPTLYHQNSKQSFSMQSVFPVGLDERLVRILLLSRFRPAANFTFERIERICYCLRSR